MTGPVTGLAFLGPACAFLSGTRTGLRELPWHVSRAERGPFLPASGLSEADQTVLSHHLQQGHSCHPAQTLPCRSSFEFSMQQRLAKLCVYQLGTAISCSIFLYPTADWCLCLNCLQQKALEFVRVSSKSNCAPYLHPALLTFLFQHYSSI